MESRNPEYRSAVDRVFHTANFISTVGYELVDFGLGWCESKLITRDQHYQHDGVIHAGVQSTMCDHTAGTAGTTLLAADEIVLTAEFKINLLRGTKAKDLRCRADVIKAGRQLIIAKSELWDPARGRDQLIAFAVVTLAVVKPK